MSRHRGYDPDNYRGEDDPESFEQYCGLCDRTVSHLPTHLTKKH